jgi:hypothetical protein
MDAGCDGTSLSTGTYAEDGIASELAAQDAPPVKVPLDAHIGCTCDDVWSMILAIAPLELARVESPPMNKPSPMAAPKTGAMVNGEMPKDNTMLIIQR